MEQHGWLTVAEAAKWLGVGQRTLYRLLHEGTIPFHTVGRAYRIKVTDLEAHVRCRPGHRRGVDRRGRNRRDRAEVDIAGAKPAEPMARAVVKAIVLAMQDLA